MHSALIGFIRGGLLSFALQAVTAAAQLQSLTGGISLTPSCPDDTQSIALTAVGPPVMNKPLSVSISGSTVKLVAQFIDLGSMPAGSQVDAVLPPLPRGVYKVEFYTRAQPNLESGGDPATLGPETLAGVRYFEVFDVGHVCAAARVEVFYTWTYAYVGQPTYVTQVRGVSTDAYGSPIGNVPLYFRRTTAPHEVGQTAPRPDLASPPTAGVTNASGFIDIVSAPNLVPGPFQYEVSLTPEGPAVGYATYYNVPLETPYLELPNNLVFEYERHTAGGSHFFMTSNQLEVRKLDWSSDWKRTGGLFMTYPAGSQGTPIKFPVCRFYGLPSAGLDSHFFSASPTECQETKSKFSSSWLLESENVFMVYRPDPLTGNCPVRTVPLYRAFNNRVDANHRYALSKDVLLKSPDSQPWVLEGDGPKQVAMCLPT